MSAGSLTASLPSLSGSLPDLFRRSDAATVSSDDGRVHADTTPSGDQQRAGTRATDDPARQLARHAALGPLTYGRRRAFLAADTAAPIGLRGAHLDVRG